MLHHLRLTIVLMWAILAVSSCALQRQEAALSPLTPEMADTVQPGLVPRYFAKFFARNVEELPADTNTRFKSRLGEPIPQLNHQFGKGEVFDSGVNRGVGIRMRGVLHFPSPGTYTFQALSNDGIKMLLGDTVVVSDPVQHSDQLSGETSIEIPAAGWYPVRLDYFQRKGTAALKLFWKTPENTTMTVVPANAYGHLPESKTTLPPWPKY